MNKTILILTLLRLSSSVRVVSVSTRSSLRSDRVVSRPVLGPPIGFRQGRQFPDLLSGPAIRSEYSSSHPSTFSFYPECFSSIPSPFLSNDTQSFEVPPDLHPSDVIRHHSEFFPSRRTSKPSCFLPTDVFRFLSNQFTFPDLPQSKSGPTDPYLQF